MAVDFKSLLSKPSDDITKPKPLPAGTYNGMVSKYEFGESKEKKTPYVRFFLTVHSAGEDIDPADIEGIDLTKKQLRRDFYLTDDALYRLKEFAVSIGVEATGRSLGEMIPDCVNAQVLIAVTQRNSQDGSEIYNDVGDVKGA